MASIHARASPYPTAKKVHLHDAVSFFMAAFAPNAIFLFFARALDGITAGNLPVASAVISDSTEIKNRAKGFAIIGASFGFGFVFGPAISALTVGYGEHIPFLIAGVISLISVILTAILLPETNKHIGEVKKEKIYNFKKLLEAITYENIGYILLISLFASIAFSMYTFVFQPFSINVLNLKVSFIALMFTGIGIIGLITQVLLLARVSKKFGEIRVITASLLSTTILFIIIFFIRNIYQYLTIVILISFCNSFINPLVQTLLSKETDEKSQGSIMGLNASYVSIGTTVGPIIGGLLATITIPLPFLCCALMLFICYLLSIKLKKTIFKKESSF